LPNEAALQAAKKRGQRPGNPGIAEAAKLGRANARRFAANMRPIIDEIMQAGGVQMHDPTLKSTNTTCWKTRFFGYLFFHVATIASGPTLPTPTPTT
jgi:DNA invertase Pin-like site-specific DNA recombinase